MEVYMLPLTLPLKHNFTSTCLGCGTSFYFPCEMCQWITFRNMSIGAVKIAIYISNPNELRLFSRDWNLRFLQFCISAWLLKMILIFTRANFLFSIRISGQLMGFPHCQGSIEISALDRISDVNIFPLRRCFFPLFTLIYINLKHWTDADISLTDNEDS